jgi:hypothetical protein
LTIGYALQFYPDTPNSNLAATQGDMFNVGDDLTRSLNSSLNITLPSKKAFGEDFTTPILTPPTASNAPHTFDENSLSPTVMLDGLQPPSPFMGFGQEVRL